MRIPLRRVHSHWSVVNRPSWWVGVIVIRLLLGGRMKDVAIAVMLSVHSSIVLSVHMPREGDSSS